MAEVVGPLLVEAAEVVAVMTEEAVMAVAVVAVMVAVMAVMVAVMAVMVAVMVAMMTMMVAVMVAVMADPPVVVGTVEELATLLADLDNCPDLDMENERLVMPVGADAVASAMDDIAEGNVAAGVTMVTVVAVTTMRAEAVVVVKAVLAVREEDLDLLEDELLALLMAGEVENKVVLLEVEVHTTVGLMRVAVVAAPAEVPMTAMMAMMAMMSMMYMMSMMSMSGEKNGAVVREELAAVVPVAATEPTALMAGVMALVEAVGVDTVMAVVAVMVAVVMAVMAVMVAVMAVMVAVMAVMVAVMVAMMAVMMAVMAVEEVAVVVAMMSMVSIMPIMPIMRSEAARLDGDRVHRRDGRRKEGGEKTSAHGCWRWS